MSSLQGADQSFGSVTCAICDAENNGTELSPEIQDALTGNVRLPGGFMAPRIAVSPEAKDMPDDPVFGKNHRQGLGIGHWVQVIKNNVFRVIAGKKEEVPLSKQVARSKKRGRVFELEDNESKVVDSAADR